MVAAVTDATFADDVLKSTKPVLVDYWADWCTPCKQIAPILEELDREYGDKITFLKLDTNDNPNTPMQYGIMSIPTLQLFVNGEVVQSLTGSKSKGAIVKALGEYYEGKFPGGQAVVMDAKLDGVGLPMATSRFTTFTQADYDAVFKKLVDGEVKLQKDSDVASVNEITVENVKVTEFK